MLAENLQYEIDKADGEWKEISSDIAKLGFAGASGSLLATGPAIASGLGLWVAGASMLAGIGTASYGRMKYDSYRKRFPASFFIGLEK